MNIQDITTRSEPGLAPDSVIYYGMSFEDYCDLPGINASAIKKGITPSHMHAYLSGEMDNTDTDDRRFGRAIHCGILEGKVLAERFPIATPCAAILKSGARKNLPCGSSSSYRFDGLWYCGKHSPDGSDQPADFISLDQKRRLEKMIAKLRDSMAHEHLRHGEYHGEVCIQWMRGDLLCKTRIDQLGIGRDSIHIVDLKKSLVGKADEEECRKKVLNLGYHIAAKMNVEAVEATFGTAKPIQFYLLFQEDSAPFEVNLMPATNDDLLVAQRTIDARLNLYSMCLKAGKFYGYQWLPEHMEHDGGILPAWYVEKVLFPDEIQLEDDSE
jgi:hypothetical protein